MIFTTDEMNPSQPRVEWTGKTHCDFCGENLSTTPPKVGKADVFLYDFATMHGPWAVGCIDHYLKWRASTFLGTGRGQEYKRTDNGTFIKTRG